MARTPDWTLRPAGAVLIGAAALIAERMLAIGRALAGHEPASVYALAALAFLSASIGAALLFIGPHLRDRIALPGHWVHQRPRRSRKDGTR